MKNSEKHTTPEERVQAFDKYCALRSCENCELDKYERHDLETFSNALYCACAFHWLDLEAEENQDAKL